MVRQRSNGNLSRAAAPLLSDVAGCLSLPIAAVTMLCFLSRTGNPVWSFGILWIAFGLGIVGARMSTGLGRICGQVTVVLISVGLIFAILLMPSCQQARE